MTDAALLTARIEQHQLPPEDFHHRDHVLVAFTMLSQYDFVEACSRYASTIRAMAEKAGAPEKFNATITFAFMSIIAERRARRPELGLDKFLATNADLLDRQLLSCWYSSERLQSACARSQFLLPDKPGAAAQERGASR